MKDKFKPIRRTNPKNSRKERRKRTSQYINKARNTLDTVVDSSRQLSGSVSAKIQDFSEPVSKKVSQATDSMVDYYEQIKENERLNAIQEKTRDAISRVVDQYSESKVKEAVGFITTKTGDHLDILSGAAILKEVKERLEKQDHYNNILATKLAESIGKITELEHRMKSIEKRNEY